MIEPESGDLASSQTRDGSSSICEISDGSRPSSVGETRLRYFQTPTTNGSHSINVTFFVSEKQE